MSYVFAQFLAANVWFGVRLIDLCFIVKKNTKFSLQLF